MSHLAKGRDAGGVRWFLDGRPVHAGTGLELRLPEGPLGPTWTPVRFETRPDAGGDLVPLLCLYVGHQWERRFRAVPAASIAAVRPDAPPGSWIVFDEKRGRRVTATERTEPDEDHPEGRPVYGNHLSGETDVWPGQSGAEREARSLNEVLAGCPSVEIVVRDPGAVELRWPEGRR